MTYQNLTLQIQESIATVVVNREKALNALNPDVLRDIQQCFHSLSDNHEVRAIILTGAGEKAFVAGADIASMSTMSEADAVEFGRLGHEAMNAVDQCTKPVIAAVNGFCLGGGLELALSCDFIYASEKAKFGLPEVNLGLFPGWGGTQRLARLIGKNKTRELIFTGKVILATDAFIFGMINKLCKPEELMNEVRAIATDITKRAPLAIQMAKKVIHEGFNLSLAQGLLKEREAFPKCFATQDLKEGLAAFLEKKQPNFKGK